MNRYLFASPGRLAWRLGGRAWGSPALARLRNHPRTTLLCLGLAALAAALVLGASTGRSSSGNCFAGALSKDPIHCQVLTAAYDEGVLDIEAMYTGRNLLYIFIANPESEGQAINDYIYQKAKQAVQADPVPHCFTEEHPDWCNGGTMELPFSASGPPRGALLPGSEQYANLRLIPGGKQALTEQPGWASFKHLWPASDAILAGAGGDGTFDLSDVDLVVDGEPDCSNTYHSGCKWYHFNPNLEIVGDWGNFTNPEATKLYEVKAEPGKERERIKAVKAAFARNRPDLKPGVNWAKRVFVPVKYSYLELWRWATLLDRFAQSRSNDIGVERAEVGANTGVEPYESHYLAGVAPAGNTDRPRDMARIRTTIEIWSFEPQKTIRALPQLLSQLGIPEDAVGVVVDGNELPTAPEIPE